MLVELNVRTSAREQLVNVTRDVQHALSETGMRSGTVVVWVPHTTAGVTVNENADPTVCSDVLQALSEVVPRARAFYRHSEGNSDAHVKSSLMGCSTTVIVEGGRLVLGTWQGIYFAEFDGPRHRKLLLKLQPDPE